MLVRCYLQYCHTCVMLWRWTAGSIGACRSPVWGSTFERSGAVWRGGHCLLLWCGVVPTAACASTSNLAACHRPMSHHAHQRGGLRLVRRSQQRLACLPSTSLSSAAHVAWCCRDGRLHWRLPEFCMRKNFCDSAQVGVWLAWFAVVMRGGPQTTAACAATSTVLPFAHHVPSRVYSATD